MKQTSLLLLLIAMLAACSSPLTSTSTSSGKYTEDLSVWRPEVTPVEDTTAADAPAPEHPERRIRTPEYTEPRLAVNDQVNVILDSIYDRNLKNGYVDGYTIQVYSGIRREEALNVKKEMTLKVPALSAEVQYRQPNFRVRTGQYYTRLEAQRDYLAVKRYFPNAIVIPDRIPLP